MWKFRKFNVKQLATTVVNKNPPIKVRTSNEKKKKY